MPLFSSHQGLYLANAPTGRTAQTWTNSLGATLNTNATFRKFGTGSLNATSASGGYQPGYFTVTGHNDSSFTLEGQFRFSSFSTSYRTLFGNRATGSGNAFSLGVYDTNIITLQNNSGSNQDFSLGISLATNTFYHIALTVDGSTCKLYINGTQRDGNKTLTGDKITVSGAGRLLIGYGSIGQSFDGYIDEIRLSTGLRYTAGFTAPTAAFDSDATTVLLCHCDAVPPVDSIT
jgi:hypothetical protein